MRQNTFGDCAIQHKETLSALRVVPFSFQPDPSTINSFVHLQLKRAKLLVCLVFQPNAIDFTVISSVNRMFHLTQLDEMNDATKPTIFRSLICVLAYSRPQPVIAMFANRCLD
ncbi:MAG TPA: hypothetical protein V6C97_00730 [Oculatellaceae cyanobacterium]